MNTIELQELVKSIDPANMKYILADCNILDKFDDLNRWENKDPMCLAILPISEDQEKHSRQIAEMLKTELAEMIQLFDGVHLTPANAKAGDGATINLFSDRHAGTIVKVTKSTITIRQDKAILNPEFKPEFIPGGFSAHCTNQDCQTYFYEPNINGNETTIHWSSKYNRYGTPGNVTASKGRHEFYDYNF